MVLFIATLCENELERYVKKGNFHASPMMMVVLRHVCV